MPRTGSQRPPLRVGLPVAGMLMACLAIGPPATGHAGQAVLHMAIGDPARSDHEVGVALDTITDTDSGETITPQEMAARLAGTGLLFIGENHTSQAFHDVQLRTIRALHEAGREVLVGLEMFPYTEQRLLDNWNAGYYSEEGFVELAGWYTHWGYHWNYYRDIFRYARQHGIRLYALNSPREAVRTVRSQGFDALTAAQKAALPPVVAPATDEYRRMYRAFFPADDALHMNEAALEGLYRAQLMWDATMGWQAVQRLRDHGGDDAIMVVLIGAGHVTFGLGAERQVAPHYGGRIASLVPVPVMDDDGAPVTDVRASYARFIWGLPHEGDTVYPVLGVSLMGTLGKAPGQVIQVSPGSAAARAGIRVGDVLLTLDGQPVDGDVALRARVAVYRWGDVAVARVRRDDRELSLPVPFRRTRP